MTTIYKTDSEFYARENKDDNGVSLEFSQAHPNWQKENEENEGCWNCSGCSGCSDCSGCSGCSDCSGCSRCKNIAWLSDKKNLQPEDSAEPSKSWFDVPVIKDIHRTILDAAAKPDALNMGDWHTCETTHCRAGWAVFLAGERGRTLELASSTLFAAMQIYKARYYARWSALFTVREIKRSDCDTQLSFELHYINERERVGINYMVATLIFGASLGGLFVALGIAWMK